jgi:ATP-binding cassette subfamily B multidrug efflux pump
MSEKRQSAPRRSHGGPHGMAMSVEKAKDFKGTLRKLIKYLEPDLLKIGVVVVFAVGAMMFTIIAPKILGNITTEIYLSFVQLQQGVQVDVIGKISPMILTLIILYVGSALFAYVQNFVMVGVTQNTVYRLRRDVKDKLTRLPLKYYDEHSYGDTLSRVTNDVDTIGSTLQQGLNNFVTAIVVIIGVLIYMFSINWILTLVALITLPLSAIFIAPIIKRSQKYFKAQQKEIGDLNGHIEEMFSSHQIVKAYGKEEDSLVAFESINRRLHVAAWRASFMSGIIMPVINLVNNIVYVLIVVVGAVLLVSGNILIGDIQSFITYVRLFSQPISNVAGISNLIQSTIAASERVFELLEESDESYSENKRTFEKDINGDVTIKNLAFSYKEDKPLITNLNVSARSGETVAIVGPTGAGKTTLVNLLLRFYDTQNGDILIDGQSIYETSREDVRSAFGMVLQDTWLFKGTIMENIRYGKLDATDDEVIEAAKIADVDHFIRTLKDGYQTIINEEASNISQGQKQLITIARAVLADPAIMILDEATSSVDTRTEQYIQNSMLKLMHGRTNFVIAHRLSTIKNASKILVMDNGDIVETGTHQELLEAKGFYHDLYHAQFAKTL